MKISKSHNIRICIIFCKTKNWTEGKRAFWNWISKFEIWSDFFSDEYILITVVMPVAEIDVTGFLFFFQYNDTYVDFWLLRMLSIFLPATLVPKKIHSIFLFCCQITIVCFWTMPGSDDSTSNVSGDSMNYWMGPLCHDSDHDTHHSSTHISYKTHSTSSHYQSSDSPHTRNSQHEVEDDDSTLQPSQEGAIIY